LHALSASEEIKGGYSHFHIDLSIFRSQKTRQITLPHRPIRLGISVLTSSDLEFKAWLSQVGCPYAQPYGESDDRQVLDRKCHS
jgi:hypothetical protein